MRTRGFSTAIRKAVATIAEPFSMRTVYDAIPAREKDGSPLHVSATLCGWLRRGYLVSVEKHTGSGRNKIPSLYRRSDTFENGPSKKLKRSCGLPPAVMSEQEKAWREFRATVPMPEVPELLVNTISRYDK